jgi:hypothetical protein
MTPRAVKVWIGPGVGALEADTMQRTPLLILAAALAAGAITLPAAPARAERMA